MMLIIVSSFWFLENLVFNRLMLGREYTATLWDLKEETTEIASFSFVACKLIIWKWNISCASFPP